MKFEKENMNQYRVSTDSADFDFNVIHGFISRSYWASNIPKDTLQKAINNSLCFSVLDDSSGYSELVGFARMITDKATYAYMADVFILPSHQGLGISKLLITKILDHPDLQGLRRIVLATKDAHGLYEQFGFKALTNPQTFMELWTPNIYQ